VSDKKMQAPPCTPGQHAFGYLVPGRPPQYSDSFQQVEVARWIIDIENSQQIRDVVVFLAQVLEVEFMPPVTCLSLSHAFRVAFLGLMGANGSVRCLLLAC
jgi:hypothetical protein